MKKFILIATAICSLARAQMNVEDYRNLYHYTLLEQKNTKNTYILGDSGWVSVESDIASGSGVQQGIDQTLDFIAAVNNSLKKRNIKLIVAVIPNKTRLYATELLPQKKLLEPNASNYQNIMQGLATRGVFAPDLAIHMLQSPLLTSEKFYYQWDSHWNQTGAKFTVYLLREYVLSRWDLSLVQKTFRSVVIDPKAPVPTDILDKDLMLLGQDLTIEDRQLLHILPKYNDTYARYSTIEVNDQQASDDAALFSDPVFDVVLLGSSFSQETKKHNFEGFLEEAFQSPVLNYAVAGGGATKAAENYFLSKNYKNFPPKLVIWEVPEYAMGTAGNIAAKLSKTLPAKIEKP